MYDIIVVGAGPAGLRVAEYTARKGYSTLVLEDHKVIGKPVECAGLVSMKVLSMTGTESVLMTSKEATVHPPTEEPLHLEASEPKAAVIDRHSFDLEMAEKAAKAGAEIKLGCRVVDTESKNGKREVIYREEDKKKRETARIVVGADGPTSMVRRKEGLPGPEETLPAVQAVVGTSQDDIHIHLGDHVAPGFFAWQLSYPSGTLIGLATNDGKTYEHLHDLLKKKGLEEKVITYLSGTIPLGDIDESVSDSLMLVGDAACQVKPLSGGGIYPGLRSADICSEVAVKALEDNDTSRERLMEYHRSWKDAVGKEISKGMWARDVFLKLSDKNLDDLISHLKKDKVKKVLAEEGDIDYPSRVARSAIKTSPSLIKFGGPILKTIF